MSRYNGASIKILLQVVAYLSLRLFCEAGGIVRPKRVAEGAKRPGAN